MVVLMRRTRKGKRAFTIAELAVITFLRYDHPTEKVHVRITAHGTSEKHELRLNEGGNIGELGYVCITKIDKEENQVYFGIKSPYHVRRMEVPINPAKASKWKQPQQPNHHPKTGEGSGSPIRYGRIIRNDVDVTPETQAKVS